MSSPVSSASPGGRSSFSNEPTVSFPDLESSRDVLQSAAPVVDEPLWPREKKAYISLAGCFFLMFNSWGLVNAYGTFSSYYKDTLLPEKDLLLFNLIGSTQCFWVLLFSGVVGRIFDANHCKHLIGAGTFFVTLGMMLLSIVNGDGGFADGNYSLIWVTQGLVTGLGMACFFVTSSAVASTWFKRRKMVAIGIVASGASIAGLVYPTMLRYLILMSGFNNAVRYVATLVGLTSLFSFFAARPNPAHKWRHLDWTNKREWVDTHAFRNHSYAWFVASISFMFLGFYAVFFNLEEWAVFKGVGIRDSRANIEFNVEDTVQPAALETFWLLSIMNVCSSLGRVGSAYAAEHFGTVNVHAFATTITSLLCLTLWILAENVSAAIAFVVLFGAFSGAVIGLPPASVAWIIQESHGNLSNLGQWVGMMYTLAAIPALVGPVIAGHLITEFGTYITVQAWSGACLFIAAFCMWMSSWSTRREAKRADREREVKGKEPSPSVSRDMVAMSTATTIARDDNGIDGDTKEKEKDIV